MQQLFLDDLILYNLLMNGLLLAVTAYLAKEKVRWLRLFGGALLGSLYLITFFIPKLHFLTSVVVRWLCPLPMIAITFRGLPWFKHLRLMGLFYLVSMGAGGVTLGSYFLAQTNPWWTRGLVLLHRVPSWLPVAGLIAFFVLFNRLLEHVRTLWRRSDREMLVRVTLDGRSMTVKALLDTGNELKDPISGRPVMVVERQELAPIIPIDMAPFLDDDKVLQLAEALGSTHLAERMRLLPFRSIGKAGGMMLALRPDKIEIETGQGMVVVPDLLVAFGSRIAPANQAYRALLPVDISDRLPSASQVPSRVASL